MQLHGAAARSGLGAVARRRAHIKQRAHPLLVKGAASRQIKQQHIQIQTSKKDRAARNTSTQLIKKDTRQYGNEVLLYYIIHGFGPPPTASRIGRPSGYAVPMMSTKGVAITKDILHREEEANQVFGRALCNCSLVLEYDYVDYFFFIMADDKNRNNDGNNNSSLSATVATTAPSPYKKSGKILTITKVVVRDGDENLEISLNRTQTQVTEPNLLLFFYGGGWNTLSAGIPLPSVEQQQTVIACDS
ncbi:hypothetical protein [Oryza sativa Japonica Group]|uniref:Uncharacterized protein P0025D05.11 n=1 Tax=Oryza sativa subsp. japonica TaxID=39947 RepID=Q9LJ32_ORYSJ|nr:hypothetical protein [Oryza sativa Japonica Group]